MGLKTRLTLLGLLEMGPNYGLGLQDLVSQKTGGRITLSSAFLYPDLRELESKGLVVSREGEPRPERGNRPRVYYELTEAGQKFIERERKAIDELLLGLTT